MENSDITQVIINTINTILGNLFSSIDNNLYSFLDDITFISSDILSDKTFEIIYGDTIFDGFLLISNSLLLGIIVYFAIRKLLSYFTYSNIEGAQNFIFKLILCGICMNFSYFLLSIFLDLFSNVSLSIRSIGETLYGKHICFSSLILDVNKNISTNSPSLDIFTLDGLIKSLISVSLLSLVFSYSFRYILIKVFLFLAPFAILSNSLNNLSWFFNLWLKNLFSLMFIQIVVSIVLLILFSIDYSSDSLFSKLLYVGGLYLLIRSNSVVQELLGGISTNISNGISNFYSKFK